VEWVHCLVPQAMMVVKKAIQVVMEEYEVPNLDIVVVSVVTMQVNIVAK
jgi:actin-related protein